MALDTIEGVSALDCAHFVLNATLYLYFLIPCNSVTNSPRA